MLTRKENEVKMLKLTYFAVLEPGENGSYSVYFLDLPGCFSYGKIWKMPNAWQPKPPTSIFMV